MSQRYSLRFDSGERRGETVPIPAFPFTIGRRPGNGLQVLDGSVSGKHAELRQEGERIVLTDLGSTNGTRIAGQRVEEGMLTPGCNFALGNVVLVFEDGQRAATAPPARPVRKPHAQTSQASQGAEPVWPTAPTAFRPAGEDAIADVPDAAALAAARRKGSKLAPLALLVLAAGAAGAWWWMRRGGGGGEREGRPVPTFPGALVHASFEDSAAAWESVGDGTGAFVRSPRAGFSGESGLSTSLEAGEQVVLASPLVTVQPGAHLSAQVELRAPDAAAGRLGLEFRRSEGASGARAAAVTAWSDAVHDAGTFQTVEVGATAPAGYDRARLLLAARAPEQAGGSVQVDDARLVPASGPPAGGAELRVGSFRWLPVGRSANLFLVDRTLLSSVTARPDDGTAMDALPSAWEAETAGFRVRPPGGAVLALRVEPVLAAGGFATLGQGGYVSRGEDFDAEGVTDLVLGRGVDLVRVAFGVPVEVRGRLEDGGWRLRATLPNGCAPLVQVDFQAERDATVNLRADAEEALRTDNVGACLAAWGELLDRYPFEEAVVQRAQTERARLLQRGFEEVRAVSDVLERADFFQLPALYQECRATARAIAARYAGSEVERAAHDLEARVHESLAALGADQDALESVRRRGILTALESEGSEALASEVRAALQTPEEGRD